MINAEAATGPKRKSDRFLIVERPFFNYLIVENGKIPNNRTTPKSAGNTNRDLTNSLGLVGNRLMSILSGLDAVYIERLKKRFWSKVEKSEGCWPWTSARDLDGYGLFQIGGTKTIRAHRLAYELSYGGLTKEFVLHQCDNPSCVNPAHLRLGSHAQNMEEMRIRNRACSGDRHIHRINPLLTTGENNGRAKLSEDQVREIKKLYQPRVVTAKELAERFGVSISTVKDILRGRRWTHISE